MALLTEPTPRAARAVALAMLDAADAARVRLDDPADREALHDFRVALRRLRSWLRAYHGELRDGIGRKVARRIGHIAAATTGSRDIEVHLEWLAAQRRTMTPGARPAAAWLSGRLAAAKVRADAALREAVAEEYAEVSARLRKKLSRYPVAVLAAEPDERWAVTAAARLHDTFLALRQRLAAFDDVDNDKAGHRARIAAKRLRYMLEPLDGAIDGIHDAVAALKVAQDLLGSMHDAHVFRRTLRRYGHAAATGHGAARHNRTPPARHRRGLGVLVRRLARRRHADWASFSSDWMPGRFPALADGVHAIVQRLRDAGGAGVEIERKYLLHTLPPEVRGVEPAEIEQGYLPGHELVERLRRVQTRDGVSYFRTVKSGTGLVRTELEESCTRELFDAMWPFTKGRRLRKRRYRLADAGHTWEIDAFTDRTLTLAEIELTSAREPVVLPDWLARCTECEVTGDPMYLNANLAR
ncbi:MAG TPA: CHAD domain-containing protein [Gemmatimonadaceae bacterium]|nr:CHAD domain-containing protein [Gemmatimonadaceae bacterium]